jgi:ABC-type transporter Mla maintaining outer membrane lipid asymmetry ATPase subunit MlaF
MADILLSTRNLWPQNFSAATSGLDLMVDDQTFLGVIGPDQTAQSAWLQTLAGIELPAQGQVMYKGQDLARMQKHIWQHSRIELAYLSQNTALLSVLPTLENILLPALHHQLGVRNELLDTLHDMLQAMGFNNWDKLKKLPAFIDELAYSQAMIARALLLKPKVIFINNAFRMLDTRNLFSLFDYIRHYADTHHAALVLYSHEAKYACQHARSMLFVTRDQTVHYPRMDDFRVTDKADVLHYLNEHDLR